MTGFGFFRSIRTIVALGFGVLMALVACVVVPYDEFVREADFQNRYGDGWRAEYERVFGSLPDAHAKILVGATGFITILSILIGLILHLRKKQYGSRAVGKRRRHTHGSTVDRTIRYRRNALVGIYFGVGGIVAGVLLVVFRWGIFAEHANEIVLGVIVFLGGYSGVVSGCWYWLKAKAWTEAVVFIAFMPLAVFFVPYVRLIFLAMPAVIMIAMVMMPLVLVVVVFALPDKSGVNRRQTMRDWSRSTAKR